MSGVNWTSVEVELIVNDYFDMLFKQLNHTPFSKTQHVKRLISLIGKRSKGSIEYKHQNISAVLVQQGLPYLVGYRPLFNYQKLLSFRVIEYLSTENKLSEAIDKYLESPTLTLELDLERIKEVNKPKFKNIQTHIVNPFNQKFEIDYYKRESENRKLGLKGEELIIHYEKIKLKQLNRTDLISKVEHISQTSGDSAGFDILSYNKDGMELHIEVKTTNLDQFAPFYLTRNELNHSIENFDKYSLYRVFNFNHQPKFYQLPGSLDSTCTLTPTVYIGSPV